MARRLRIQYEGAIYHVINRGNYRRDLFESGGAAKAFEETLEEACRVNGWRLHAHVLMLNHFHLAVETPKANLVEGMHWLQSTFSSRFNRYRRESGHLFQGRYQALLVEDSAALARVVDYIHLNSVRANVVSVDQLMSFRWSSLPRFIQGPRHANMVAGDFMGQRGLADTAEGWTAYVDYLKELSGNPREQENLGFGEMCRGWAIGTKGWRDAMAKEHAHRALEPGIDTNELHELKHAHYNEILAQGLREAGKAVETLGSDRKNAPWKIDLAVKLREHGVPYRWIASNLLMGSPDSLRGFVTQRKRRSHENLQFSA